MRTLIVLAVLFGVVVSFMWQAGAHFKQKDALEEQQQAQALVKEISPDDALRLAKVVDSSESLDVRKALSNAMSDGKVTYAEFGQVMAFAERSALAREREIAKAALATAAHDYSE